MRVVLDTTVFVSGVFFSGPPFEIVDAWRRRRLQLVASAEILDEYHRVGERLARLRPGVDLAPFLVLVAVARDVVVAPELPERVCADPIDDMFFACAVAGRSRRCSACGSRMRWGRCWWRGRGR